MKIETHYPVFRTVELPHLKSLSSADLPRLYVSPSKPAAKPAARPAVASVAVNSADLAAARAERRAADVEQARAEAEIERQQRAASGGVVPAPVATMTPDKHPPMKMYGGGVMTFTAPKK